MSNEVTIWNYLKSKGFTDYAAAGIMGNLYAESGLLPKNLQTTYEYSLGMNDDQYTEAVDNGSYTGFVHDAAGYGLAQWTFWSRKEGLLKLAKQHNASVGDITIQLVYLWKELQEFGIVEKLNNCNTVRDASNIMLLDFEKPYDTGKSVQDARAYYSQGYYDKYANKVVTPMPSTPVLKVRKKGYQVIASKRFDDVSLALDFMDVIKKQGMDVIVTEVTY